MKTVCIVGAGPAGLASAKVLLQTAQFDVSLFEQSDQIGGIWNIDQQSPGNGFFLHPDTPTNLSRFTVAFSDLDWHSVGLNAVPMFPKAWQVNKYLEAYARKNIPSSVFHFGHRVIKTELSEGQWRITVQDSERQESVQYFDHLLLGSGFFSKPKPIDRDVPNVASDLRVKAIHSSQFRHLSDLFSHPADASGKTILMIGGGNSAGEAAAAVAQQLSDAWYSPTTGQQQLYRDCKIVHVTPRPLYALPPYNPVDEQYQTYVPLDLKLYDLYKRPAGPIIGNAGQITPAVKDMIHNALQTQIGGDQSDLGSPGLKIPSEEPRSTVYVALSESYAEFVRSALISVIQGRVASIHSSSGTCSATVSGPSEQEITNIGAIIYATGYSPSTAVSFLPEDVKQKLHYDSTSTRLPLILSGWQTMSPEVPSLALIGFYEGPYWGMIEMQARYTAQRWLNDAQTNNTTPSPPPPPPNSSYENPQDLLSLRQAIISHTNLFIPQYWFGDYAGYMEQLASPSHLNLTRNDLPFPSSRSGPVSPSRYLSPHDDRNAAEAIMQDLHTTYTACLTQGKFLSRAVFRALQGEWKISRVIDSHHSASSSVPSGTLEGQAAFHPRRPTAKGFDAEFLYVESGRLSLSSNGSSGYGDTKTTMPAKKRYVYRHSELRDELSVWFVKADDELEVDYLFHTLAFSSSAGGKSESESGGGIKAKANHLCVKDMYWTEYSFPLKGIGLKEFRLEHRVRGPEKEYVARTEFRRKL